MDHFITDINLFITFLIIGSLAFLSWSFFQKRKLTTALSISSYFVSSELFLYKICFPLNFKTYHEKWYALHLKNFYHSVFKVMIVKTGFTESHATDTYLPVNSNYFRINVESEKEDTKSHLNNYKRVAKLRNQPEMLTADVSTFLMNANVYALVR